MKNQKQTWDKIAPKWNLYRTKISKEVEEFMKNQKGKLLDIGCGSGRNFIQKKDLEIYGVDFSDKMIKLAEEKGAKELKVAKADNLPYPDNYFNSSICISVLHCLKPKQQEKTLKELFRVLKPQSEIFISVWSKNKGRLKNKPKQCFIPWTVKKEEGKEKRYTYIYNKKELEKQIKKSGFKIKKSWEDKNINIIAKKS